MFHERHECYFYECLSPQARLARLTGDVDIALLPTDVGIGIVERVYQASAVGAERVTLPMLMVATDEVAAPRVADLPARVGRYATSLSTSLRTPISAYWPDDFGSWRCFIRFRLSLWAASAPRAPERAFATRRSATERLDHYSAGVARLSSAEIVILPSTSPVPS